MKLGEKICGEWLRHVKDCEFVQYNLKTTKVQGEIDFDARPMCSCA
ncbi:MAG: hypothetical protein GY946_25095 [bacterium]|nr:hypothetical protein [bacterium]